ncbi:S1C family serine protease [Paenibacillus abyssi]|uniref:Peptidase S1 n=1 Tax=Paenibacillus abyssi TaxID=1340531 RepID=A0A917FYK9_9BACL|nr:trypsin-like peptidase domain-containing protein [Paenibacillus abyssi]GGG14311.1 peptidase S1 [Paenibacillus abyssi]
MKTWMTILISAGILAAGGVSIYYLNDIWNNPVVTAESKLGPPGSTADPDEATPDLKEMIREHQKRVVSIEAVFPDGSGQGSGFLYNDKGDVVTNAHVISGAAQVKVKASDTSLHAGIVIGMNEEHDIAVIRVDALAGKEPLLMDKETKAEIGDEVVAFGSPLGLDNTVTTGIISGIDRDIDLDHIKYRNVYQISAPITNGNSGGPLVMESSGKVIGINSAGSEQGSIGFSIPFYQVAEMLEEWSNNPDQELIALTSSTDDELSADHYTKEMMSEGAMYLLEYFYENINAGDYVTAYSLLGSNWQTKTDYGHFRKGYLYTSSVAIKNISVTSVTEDSAEVKVVIEAWENKNDDYILSSYSLDYTIRPENDTLKIISGKGKKL